MHLKSLYTSNFRNLKSGTYSFSPSFNIIRGQNGSGKTNLLEAIYVIATGGSFRGTPLSSVVTAGGNNFELIGDLSDVMGDFQVKLKWSKGRRIFSVNDNPVESLSDYIGKILVLSFSPDSLGLVRGDPQLRRGVVDRLVLELSPRLASSYGDYRKALNQKRILLKSPKVTQTALRPWNQILARATLDIIFNRISAIKQMDFGINRIYQEVFGFKERISLTYQSTFPAKIIESPEVKNIMLEFFDSWVNQEILKRRPLVGLHLDELEIKTNQAKFKYFGSQGQIRTLALALNLTVDAVIREKLGRNPIFILDDVDGELDKDRKSSLYTHLNQIQRQVFVSTVDDFYFNHIKTQPKVIELCEGKS